MNIIPQATANVSLLDYEWMANTD